jgi:hypothetical protein
MSYFIQVLNKVEKLFNTIILSKEKREEIKLFLKMLDNKEKNRINRLFAEQKKEYVKELKDLNKEIEGFFEELGGKQTK